MLGVPTGYIGVIGEDELGGAFVRDYDSCSVERNNDPQPPGNRPCHCTGDSRFGTHLCTYLGAAIELAADHLTAFNFKAIRLPSHRRIPGPES